jgi:hypothetical protein
MQVVISEGDRCGVAQRADSSQHPERVGSAVDEIAHEPQPIAIRGETQGIEQGAELFVATLHIADRVQSHQPPMG